MPTLKFFDVLIVYSGDSTVSASLDFKSPFPPGSANESYNTVYGYFLETCRKNNVHAAFATSTDIIGAGTCSSFWSFKKKTWHKTNASCYAPLIFDKFAPRSPSAKASRKLLFSSPLVHPFNSRELSKLFFDKEKTHHALTKHTIPTIALTKNTLKSITQSCKDMAVVMKHHAGSKDFNRDLVMKDRYGAGGQHVYKFKSGESSKMLEMVDRHPHVSFIIQPFAKFDQGFTYSGNTTATDIRLVYLGGNIVQSYIRVAKLDEFRCNEHQGGTLNYLKLSEIPQEIVDKADVITQTLGKQKSLYTLDFIVSNRGNSYLVEGNTGPGLDWDLHRKENAVKSKELIRLIVHELRARTMFALT